MTATAVLVLSLAACAAGDETAPGNDSSEDETAVIGQFKTAQSAIAYRGCTQEDAPALMIRLENVGDAKATVEIEVAGTENASWPMKIALSPLRRENVGVRTFGRAAYLGGKEPSFLEGEIVIAIVEKERRIEGTYALRLPDGARVAGAYTAEWRAGAVACGG